MAGGHKSNGFKTEHGRMTIVGARTSNGARCFSPVLPGETEADWCAVLDGVRARIQPADRLEEEMTYHLYLCIRELDQPYKMITQSARQTGEEFINQNSQVRPFGILAMDYLGNLSTFSPELLGQHSTAYRNFLFGNVTDGGLAQVLKSPAFLATFRAVQSGIKSCAAECEYFNYCGGGSPANKFFENGSFESAETFYCRTHLKIPFSITLEAVERSLENQARI